MEQHHYPVDVTWESDKQGRAGSPDGLPAVTVASPPEFGGPGGLWSPEHLFVAALASCYMTTYLAIAERSRLEVAGLAVPAVVVDVRPYDGEPVAARRHSRQQLGEVHAGRASADGRKRTPVVAGGVWLGIEQIEMARRAAIEDQNDRPRLATTRSLALRRAAQAARPESAKCPGCRACQEPAPAAAQWSRLWYRIGALH